MHEKRSRVRLELLAVRFTAQVVGVIKVRSLFGCGGVDQHVANDATVAQVLFGRGGETVTTRGGAEVIRSILIANLETPRRRYLHMADRIDV